MTPLFNRALIAAVAAMALVMTGCASRSTPYQPLSSGSKISGGYSDERIGEDRFRVKFAGNTLTSREKVESYLLFRAAELTLEQGMDWFAIEDRVVEHEVERQVSRDPFYDPWFGSYYRYWQPSWRYYGPRGWRSWYPYYGHTFWTDHVDVRQVERFEAMADIRLGSGEMPGDTMRAFNAREVIERIRPRVEYPGDQ